MVYTEETTDFLEECYRYDISISGKSIIIPYGVLVFWIESIDISREVLKELRISSIIIDYDGYFGHIDDMEFVSDTNTNTINYDNFYTDNALQWISNDKEIHLINGDNYNYPYDVEQYILYKKPGDIKIPTYVLRSFNVTKIIIK